MDIRAGAPWPAGRLSNFAPNGFVLDGIAIASMEGFLQSLKTANPDLQAVICTYVGAKAKASGARRNWQRQGQLHWRGTAIDRFGPDYQALLDRAFAAMANQNEGFRKALLATGSATLGHSLGKRKEKDTVLTEREFTTRLTSLRDQLVAGVVPGSMSLQQKGRISVRKMVGGAE